jgi:hypothetical protein
LEWVCGYGQGHPEETPGPKPEGPSHPEPKSKLQRKRTGPGAPGRNLDKARLRKPKTLKLRIESTAVLKSDKRAPSA